MNTITPQAFIAKWRNVTLNERAVYQSHFNDLCDLIGHKKPIELDPAGDTFRFEAGASKTSGGQGFADVWFRDHFALEYKGPHANLDKAYQQLLQYREALQNPPLLIVSDIQTIQIHTNFTGTVKQIFTIALEDLADASKRAILQAAFFDPYSLRAPLTPDQVTEQAAAHFAELAEILRNSGSDPAQAAHFLIRLLFCLFAEDTGLLPNKMFSNLVANMRGKPAVFKQALSQLFAAMSTGGSFGTDLIMHFDGRLFDDAAVLDLPTAGLDILLEVSHLNWASIEPSIFGTLFERSLDPGKRSQLGAHYTSKEDILLIVEPVLMTPLRREWAEIQSQARELAEQRNQAPAGRKRNNLHEQLTSLLMGFSTRLSTVTVLDAACGSGNFLYIALRQLLDLEKEVVKLAGELGVGAFFPSVKPGQLYGIEINETAHQLAQAAIQIGYIQWLRDNGFGLLGEPILKPLDTIQHKDAILAYDEQGKPYEPEWPAVDVIIGNPPFLGGNRMRSVLGDRTVETLFNLYRDRVPATADMVCYWFEKARHLIEDKQVKRVGLLATNSIRHSSNRVVMEKILKSGGIFWAQSDIRWVLDGADVRISMVAFDDGTTVEKYLDGKPVNRINSNLTSQIDVGTAQKLEENRGVSFIGIEKAGDFDIDENKAQEFLALKINVNGRPNSDVVKPCINAYDLAEGTRRAWIIDFNNMSLAEAAQYEAPFEHVKIHVKPEREANRENDRKELWWLFGRSRPAMREAIQTLSRYIVTPRVSKHRFFTWLDKSVVPQNKIVVIARDDNYFFGVLHSRLHEVWSLSKAGRHGVGNDPAYSNDQCFETFPFPWPPGKEPTEDLRVQAIGQAAQALVTLRDNWLNPPGLSEAELKKCTFTNLYNLRPTWLQNAHEALDKAVFAAYGWSPDLSDEDILERLLEINLERAK